MKTIFALALLAATSTLLAQDPGQLPKNLVLDLDADLGVTVEEGDHVALWQNQVAGFAARDFVLRDQGRKNNVSGSAWPHSGQRSA